MLKGSVRLSTGLRFRLKTESDTLQSKNSKKFKKEFHNHAKIFTFLREIDHKNTIFKISRNPIRKRCFQITQNARQTDHIPGVGSMGKSMEFKGRPWFPHASHASLAFPCYAKAWKSMGSMGIFFKLHQQSMD